MFLYGGLLAASLISFAVMDFIFIFAFHVVSRVYDKAASSAFLILSLFFQGCMYALVPVVAFITALENEAERLSIAHEEKALTGGQTNSAQTNGTQV